MLSTLKKPSSLILAMLGLALVSVDASAAVTNASNDYFANMYNMVLQWSQGYLARGIAIAAFLIGAIMGFARGTAMPALVGFAFAVMFSIGPTVINGILGATI